MSYTTRSGRVVKGTAVAEQYRADVAARHVRATARKASMMDKLLTQAAQLREATGIDALEDEVVKDIMGRKATIYGEKLRIENEGGSMGRYRELLRDEAPLDSRLIKALNKAIKERTPAVSAAIAGLAADEEAEMDALDTELMGLMGGLKMAGGRRRTAYRKRRSIHRRKTQRRH